MEVYQTYVNTILYHHKLRVNLILKKYDKIPKYFKLKMSIVQKLKVVNEGIVYLLDEKQNTASIFVCKTKKKEIIIPVSISYKSREYNIISIEKGSFEHSEVKSIQFDEGSKLISIESESFCFSSIESLSIPSQLISLKDGWCTGTLELTRISVNQGNRFYKTYNNDEIIIGKSIEKKENFDCLVFCIRNIKTITIPNFIEHICPCAFNRCEKLGKVEISNDSKLKTIGFDAFCGSLIESITIPSSVTKIDEGAFYLCHKLRSVVFSDNSKLEALNKEVLCKTSIESITIPSLVTKIDDFAFSECINLRKICFDKDSNLQEIGACAFSKTAIESISIPLTVKEIEISTFEYCSQLMIIEYNFNSYFGFINKIYPKSKMLFMVPAK